MPKRDRLFDSCRDIVWCDVVWCGVVSTMQLKFLCQIFGAPPSTIQRVLWRTLCALNKRLPQLHLARIEWPSRVSNQSI